MKTYLGRPKKDWWFSYKIAYAHQYMAWLTIPYLLVCIAGVVSLIIRDGEPIGAWILVLSLTAALVWHNYTGFRCMYACKQAGIDYNKPWDEV